MKDRKEYLKTWIEAHKEDVKSYQKAWYEAHKELEKAKKKEWYEAHKEQRKATTKAYRQAHKEQCKEYAKEYAKVYIKSDVNSFGETKHNIRQKSQYYLNKYGTKIPGYQIHHCCTYDDPYKFIYCSKEMHLLIHSYLRQHNIDADSDHYKYIKHILDDTVVKYNIFD